MLVTEIEDLTKWVGENICSELNFLLPSNKAHVKEYTPEIVHPAALPLYVPAKDALPPGMLSNVPSICVQVMSGSDNLTDGLGMQSLKMRLAISLWWPGTYSQGEEGTDLVKDASGWREAWLALDKARRKIESATYICGSKLDISKSVDYGFFTIDEDMVDMYPEWAVWLTFSLARGINRNHDYSNFL